MSRERTSGLTHQELEDLPLGSRVEDKDEDQYVKFLADDGKTALWVDPEQGESTHTILMYGGLRLVTKPDVAPPPASNERLIEVARRAVDTYTDGNDPAFVDAMISLSIELSTLKETS